MAATTFTLLVGGAPASAEVVRAVQSIEVDCTIDRASAFRIRLGIAKTTAGDWTVLADDAFGPEATVSIMLTAGASLTPLINGFATAREVAYSDVAGGSTLDVSGLDVTSQMNLRENVVGWPNAADSAIATLVFTTWGLIPKVAATGQPMLAEDDGTTIQRGTDIRFLHALAARNGYDCYVQPSVVPGTDEGHFEPRALTGTPDAVINVGFGDRTNVVGFSIRDDLTRPAAAAVTGVDTRTRAQQPVALAATSLQPLGRSATLEREPTKALVRPADTGLSRTAELQTAVQAIVDRSTWSVNARGCVGFDVGPLRPGHLLAIRGCGRVYSGTYFVTRVRHVIARDHYEQHFEACRNAVELTGTERFTAAP